MGKHFFQHSNSIFLTLKIELFITFHKHLKDIDFSPAKSIPWCFSNCCRNNQRKSSIQSLSERSIFELNKGDKISLLSVFFLCQYLHGFPYFDSFEISILCCLSLSSILFNLNPIPGSFLPVVGSSSISTRAFLVCMVSQF